MIDLLIFVVRQTFLNSQIITVTIFYAPRWNSLWNYRKDLKFYVAFPVYVLYPEVVIFIFIA